MEIITFTSQNTTQTFLDTYTKHFIFGSGCQQVSVTHFLPCSFALDISDELCIASLLQ